jgi:hypothetical protein
MSSKLLKWSISAESVRSMYGWRLILAILIGSSAAWLIAAFAIHFGTIAPLRAGLISDHANALAREIDSAIKVRSTLISSAVNDQHLEKILGSSRLEALVKHIENHFPEFISLEVMNHRGEILAIVGEVALSKGNLVPLEIKEAFFHLDSRAGNVGLFRDDPANGSFFITCRHRNSDGTIWYSRSRFGRSTLEEILNHEQDKGSASLVSVSGVGSDVQQVAENRHRVYNSWWSGLQAVEVSLENPGWLLKMVPNSSGSPVRRVSAIIPGLLLLLAAALYLLLARRENAYNMPDACSLRTPSTGTADAKPSKAIEIPEQKPLEVVPEKSFEPVRPAVAAVSAIPLSVLPRLPLAEPVPVTSLPSSHDVDQENENSEVYSELLCPPQLVFAPMPDTFGLPYQAPKDAEETQAPEITAAGEEKECPSEEYFCPAPESVEPDHACADPNPAEESMSVFLEWSDDERVIETVPEEVPECYAEEIVPPEADKDMPLLDEASHEEQPTVFATVAEKESFAIHEEECWVLEDGDVEVSDCTTAEDMHPEDPSEELACCGDEEIIFPDRCIREDSVQLEADSGCGWKSIALGPVTELLVTEDEYWVVSDDEGQDDSKPEAQCTPEIPEELIVEWDDEIAVPAVAEVPRDAIYAVLATEDREIPEVLEVEWNEPVTKEKSESPRKEREVVLFSEFFNF